MKVLIANRGEISNRIARAVTALGWSPQQVFARGEGPPSEHAVPLPGSGVSAYLDVEGVVSTAVAQNCEAVHPGYGFLSESAKLARACEDAGLLFVGPTPEILELFGDKGRSLEHAKASNVPVLDSTASPATDEEIVALLGKYPDGVMVKAVAGGGGRGMRAVTDPDELLESIGACRSEAGRAFGVSDVYAERLMGSARHIEVQVLGDGTGAVVAFAERDCSIQRRNQKVIEFAPSPALSPSHRDRLMQDALSLVAPLNYSGLATVEFLVDDKRLQEFDELAHVFIEVNPRLQVEHTITEELLGVDLVVGQLMVAAGADLSALELTGSKVTPAEHRYSIQSRINAEQMSNGRMSAAMGVVTDFELPKGARIDHHLRDGLDVDGTFDSLLAKVVTVTDGSFGEACAEAVSVLERCSIEGVATNIDLLKNILGAPQVVAGLATTRYLDDYLEQSEASILSSPTGEVTSPITGAVVSVNVETGDQVTPRTLIGTVEAMKMEHQIRAGIPGEIIEVPVGVGEQVEVGQVIAQIVPDGDGFSDDGEGSEEVDLELIRPDLAQLLKRKSYAQDENRPEAVAKRRARGRKTLRESIADLVDKESFIEYGALPVAAQRTRRSMDDLIKSTPADGMVTGLGRVDGRDCAIIGYDYTVLAGTQGHFNHRKTDRMIEVARKRQIPLVLFAEGGGGRPGETDTFHTIASGLSYPTFAEMGALSGEIPTIGIVGGRCFAGNAALLGCCDVIIATRDSNIGMAGPAMIEGGGLGRFTAEEIGPSSVQAANGVIDVLVDDDAAAVEAARRYLSYFTDRRANWEVGDQRALRHAISENRKELYESRELIDRLADSGSVTELRRDFGPGIISALVRIEGRPMGLIANDPAHLGGAIDADGADKVARFLQLCDAHGFPIVSLVDTPGFMVGPESEKTATVRHFSRLFVIASHLIVPMIAVVLRKGYGLGAMGMAAGGFLRPVATVSWPTGEFGPMGLEGGVRLGFEKELEAIADHQERQRRFQELVDEQYEIGKAINTAMTLEIDEVIDPINTRQWIMATVGDHDPAVRGGRYVDTW